MRVKRMLYVAALAVTAVLIVAAIGVAKNSAGGTLKIGVVIPLSGVSASPGEEIFRGYQLAIDKLGGKVAGKTIELVRGDASTPDQAIAETTRLATQENVDVFVGTYTSGLSQAGSETAARYNKLWWETHALTDTLTTRGLPNYLRGGARAHDFANASVEFIKNAIVPRLGKGLKVFVEHEDGLYGTSVSRTQIDKLRQAGFQVVEGKHSTAATDVTDSVLTAKKENPDIWMITGYVPDDNLLLKTAAAQSFRPKATMLVGTGDGRPTFDAVGPGYLTNTFVVAYSTLLSNPRWAPGIKELFTAYKGKYHSDPIGTVATTAYTGMTAFLTVLKAANGATDVGTFHDAALKTVIPFGKLPNGWGLKFNKTGQNERVRLVTVQWRSNGLLPAVYPPQARLGHATIVGVQK